MHFREPVVLTPELVEALEELGIGEGDAVVDAVIERAEDLVEGVAAPPARVMTFASWRPGDRIRGRSPLSPRRSGDDGVPR